MDAYQLTIDRIHVQLCIRSIVSFQGGKHPKISGYVSTGHIPIPLVHVYIAFNCNPSHRAKCKHANPSHRAKCKHAFSISCNTGVTSLFERQIFGSAPFQHARCTWRCIHTYANGNSHELSCLYNSRLQTGNYFFTKYTTFTYPQPVSTYHSLFSEQALLTLEEPNKGFFLEPYGYACDYPTRDSHKHTLVYSSVVYRPPD